MKLCPSIINRITEVMNQTYKNLKTKCNFIEDYTRKIPSCLSKYTNKIRCWEQFNDKATQRHNKPLKVEPKILLTLSWFV